MNRFNIRMRNNIWSWIKWPSGWMGRTEWIVRADRTRRSIWTWWTLIGLLWWIRRKFCNTGLWRRRAMRTTIWTKILIWTRHVSATRGTSWLTNTRSALMRHILAHRCCCRCWRNMTTRWRWIVWWNIRRNVLWVGIWIILTIALWRRRMTHMLRRRWWRWRWRWIWVWFGTARSWRTSWWTTTIASRRCWISTRWRVRTVWISIWWHSRWHTWWHVTIWTRSWRATRTTLLPARTVYTISIQ